MLSNWPESGQYRMIGRISHNNPGVSLVMAEQDKTTLQKVELPGGVIAYVEAIKSSDREEVGVLESIPFEQVTQALGAIAEGIGGVVLAAKPSKASVELGAEFAVKEGKLVSIIAKGEGKANLKLKLEWEFSD